MKFRIRDARQEDLPAIGRMAGQLMRMHRDFDARRWMCPEGLEEGYARYFTTQIDKPGTILVVAEDEASKAPVGYLYAAREERNWPEMRDACGRLHDLYVVEAARHHGIGRALIGEGIGRLRALGEKQIVFTSAWPNHAIRDLMTARGFRPTVVEMTADF
jgi:GNAT superfamily N-acetyltransferase